MQYPVPSQNDYIATQLAQIDDALQDRRLNDAEALATTFCAKFPNSADGWIYLGRVHLERKAFAKALVAGQKAVALDSHNAMARLLQIDGLLRCGQNKEAFEASKLLLSEMRNDPLVNLRIGNFYTRTNRHAEAARCYERARVLCPTDRAIVYNLVSAHIALGRLDPAVALLDDLLKKDPHEFKAYYTRATLRKWTLEQNHIAEMENVLGGLPVGHAEEPSLCYSLAKELEDTREWARAFAYLKRGADARKRLLTYEVESDLDMMADVERWFDDSFFKNGNSGYADESPIFVLGMPRSGTTLVDRIISSHSMVGSVGEAKEFGRAIGQFAHEIFGQEIVDVRQARELDPRRLGEAYCIAVNGLLPGYPRLLDKTPRNFMHLGQILRALPNAKIIHLRRNPVDSCYAVYKILFRDGYQFSYDLNDLGRFYLAYLKLMEHWRKLLPGRFLDVDYEDLVDNQEAVSRRMIAFCDLEWEDACLSFEKNESPSLTASAAQVRQPIYQSSVALWRRYEKELEPLVAVLREGGVEIA